MQRKIGTALVVGAGISGIRAALDLAEFGYGVTLIDRADHLGGILSQLDYQFPTDHCGMCKMLPMVDRDSASQYCLRKGLFHENIDILLGTELIALAGEPGNFQAKLRRKPSWVDPDLCVGCGECERVCAVELPDPFNAGLSTRKAIYLPVPHAIPNPYVIDFESCTRCGACEAACPTGAIRLSQMDRKDFRILVVDDELIVRDSLKEWLEEEGFAVEMAGSGPEALEQLARTAQTGQKPYNLMLLDIKMPGMDGVEVLTKAKETYPDLHVVMMTAYATVQTAVEAMKIGALEYLIKPFDPDSLIPMARRLYQELEVAQARQLDVGAVILCGGTDFFDPGQGQNTFGYGVYPNVVTSLEFERILSASGPCRGRMLRPADGKPISRVAFIQCVGSRDLHNDADYCSNVCCMYAVKEALMAKEKSQGKLEAAIFYMDMRTFGKRFQRYRDQAETLKGVRFERARVHSVVSEEYNGRATGDLIIRYVDLSGRPQQEQFDMVVLALGQRASCGSTDLAKLLELSLNQWGFYETAPFSMTRTEREGILLAGGFSGLKDISDSVIQASASALNASRVIHAAGGGLAPEPAAALPAQNVLRELPRVLMAVCTCGGRLAEYLIPEELERHFKKDPAVDQVVFLDKICTAAGWEELVGTVTSAPSNRILIGACLPYVYARKLRELGRQVALDPVLMDVVDIRTPAFYASQAQSPQIHGMVGGALEMGLARLKRIEPLPAPTIGVVQQALVVGGGIAGMTAALAVADHGYAVDLLEQESQLGGNLKWLKRTLQDESTEAMLKTTLDKVQKHPLIRVHPQTRVNSACGQVGHFSTVVEDAQGAVNTLEHGAVILAAGGTEAATSEYGYGTSPAIVTQMQLEQQINSGSFDYGQLQSVVMIQCVGSREEPRNYCSRVCCSSSLKHALFLKEHNPDMSIYVLYRDMMTYGFSESYYTRARKAGILFIAYETKQKPQVHLPQEANGPLQVTTLEPIIGQHIEIEADLIVLATGIVSGLPKDLAEAYGAGLDQDGFFQEAESKWRPVDSLKEGIFACGLAQSPRSIPESIASAEAAAVRALRILSRKRLPAGKVLADVHVSLCSLCERCIDACPYGARIIDEELEAVQVNPVMCQGCGACAAACPNGAAFVEGYASGQMLEVIDAALWQV